MSQNNISLGNFLLRYWWVWPLAFLLLIVLQLLDMLNGHFLPNVIDNVIWGIILLLGVLQVVAFILSIAHNNEEPFVETDVDFNHYFDNIVGVSHPDGGVVEHIVLRGDKWVEHYLHTLPIHPLQQLESLGDEGCRVTLHVMVNNELRQELAFYGEHLQVESPESLKQIL